MAGGSTLLLLPLTNPSPLDSTCGKISPHPPHTPPQPPPPFLPVLLTPAAVNAPERGRDGARERGHHSICSGNVPSFQTHCQDPYLQNWPVGFSEHSVTEWNADYRTAGFGLMLQNRNTIRETGAKRKRAGVSLSLSFFSYPVSIHSSYIPFQVLLGGELHCELVNGRLWECLSFY